MERFGRSAHLDSMRARILRIAAVATISAFPATATEADALAISANIQAIHIPFGTILDPIYAGAQSTQIIDYTRCGDSAIWTGHYLAAEAFRYAVTQSPDALNNVNQAIAGIKSLLDVTGTNVLARCIVPKSSPYAAGIQSQEVANGIYTTSTAEYFWVGNTSRDQYMGVAFGLAVAYDLINDSTVQNSISQIVARLVGFLTGNDWSVVMPDGSVSTTFLVRPDEMVSLLQVGRHVDSSDFSTDYDIARATLSAAVLAPIAVDTANDSSYFKFNLDYITLYNLIRLESSDFKAVYQAAYSTLRSATSSQQNAIFDMIDRALNGPDASRDAEAAGLINEWLQRSRRDNSVNLQNVVAVCGSQACSPIPVVLRPPDEYLWEESPFQLSGGGSGIIETAGIDYILPYWMARYYGVIPAVEVQSSAAPTGGISPDSMASIYGPVPAATTQVAGTQPPPVSLGGIGLTVIDSAGVLRSAPLMYASPTQINFVVPDGTAVGAAQFVINPASGSPVTTTGTVQAVVPTLFDMTGEGPGVAAAYAIQTTAVNPPVQSILPVFNCSGSTCQPAPIPLNADANVTLVLYGTGIRNRSSLANVAANINGLNVPVLYAGAQPSYEGFDQVNLSLPSALSGSGQVNVFLIVDGQPSNVVVIDIE